VDVAGVTADFGQRSGVSAAEETLGQERSIIRQAHQ
jgi:hypothetical protein